MTMLLILSNGVGYVLHFNTYITAPTQEDPKERKRPMDRERYVQNTKKILKRRCDAWDQKKPTSPLPDGEQTPSYTMMTMSPGILPVLLSCSTSPIQGPESSKLQGRDSLINENINTKEDSDWLHKNDAYETQEIGGRRRPINVPSAAKHGESPKHNYYGTY